jgi:predicted RNA-binding Zn-ribbon protein involved in translation (DUF1610 family)
MNENNEKLRDLLEDFGVEPEDLEWNYSTFWTDEKCIEYCSNCETEVEITEDGKTDCPVCGDKEVLPCMLCPLHDLSLCDWDEETRCSAFPITATEED